MGDEALRHVTYAYRVIDNLCRIDKFETLDTLDYYGDVYITRLSERLLDFMANLYTVIIEFTELPPPRQMVIRGRPHRCRKERRCARAPRDGDAH